MQYYTQEQLEIQIGVTESEINKLKEKNSNLVKQICTLQKENDHSHKYYPDSFDCWYALPAGFLGFAISAIVSRINYRSWISDYFSRPENADKLQYYLDKTGASDLSGLSTYLLGEDGFAKMLFRESGARDYVMGNFGVSVLTGTAIGVAIGIAPYAYYCIHDKLENRKHHKIEIELKKIHAQIAKNNLDIKKMQDDNLTLLKYKAVLTKDSQGQNTADSQVQQKQ